MKKKREAVDAKELVVANAMEIDALVEILVRKGILTRGELLSEIRTISQHTRASERLGRA